MVFGTARHRLAGMIDGDCIIGIFMLADTSILYALPLAHGIKERFGAIVIAGGYAAWFAHPILLTTYGKLFDAVVVDPGEAPLLAIVERFDSGDRR